MVRPCGARGFRRSWLMLSCINVSGFSLKRVVLRAIMDISAPAISLSDEAFDKEAFCLRVRFKTSSRITELSQHEANGREFQEREGVAIEIFPVLGEAAATVEPRN